MIKLKKFLPVLLFLFLSLSLLIPTASFAAGSSKTSFFNGSLITGLREKIAYFFAFTADKKIEVLEKQAENRLDTAQTSAENGDNQQLQSSLQNYLQTKEKQDTLLDQAIDSQAVLEKVQEKTIEQQKTMEEIKAQVTDQDTKQEVVQAQEQVVNQVAKNVVNTSGTEGLTEFFQKVEHVWAPGTGPGGGEPGVVVEGGTMQFAPGTSAGGNGSSDIKQVEVKGN